jgi:2,3-bisphosphoglycerate-dependent phosphoglycerate mutase
MSVIYLVRHAHVIWNPDENRPLSPQGFAATAQVADALEHFPITAIVSSPARRARQTIEPLAERLHLPIQEIDDLAERRLSSEPVEDFLAAVRATWDDPSFIWPGGESNMEAQRRGVAVIEELAHKGSTDHIVVATHGNLLALILQRYDTSVGFAFWQALTMPDIYRLEISADGKTQIQRLWVYV